MIKNKEEVLQEIKMLEQNEVVKRLKKLKASLYRPIEYISKIQFNSLVYRDPDICYRIV